MSVSLLYLNRDRHATWLELFFDLVFVAAIGSITHSLAHLHHGHLSLSQVINFVLSMLSVWWLWVVHTLYANRFDTDKHGHRVSSLLIMLVMSVMAGFCGSHLVDNLPRFLIFYGIIRVIQAGMYAQIRLRHSDGEEFARKMVVGIVIGTLLTASSLLVAPPVREVLFAAGILFEVVWTALASKAAKDFPVHLPHLVERVGLMSIIILGESVISMVGSLQQIEWTPDTFLAMTSGFLIIGLIWWIYFDSFNILERAKRLESGLPVLYASFFFVLGLALIATAIRFGIQGGLNLVEFRWTAVLGILCFYIGKQTSYYYALPVFRKNILINSTACVVITLAAFLLPRPSLVLCGIAAAMGWYVFSNYRWTLAKDPSPYLLSEENAEKTA